MTLERDVWYPISVEQSEETPYQQKIGGSIPFFTKGESWPRNEDGCLQFIGQVNHPTQNKLLRFFWDPPYVNWGSGSNCVVLSANPDELNSFYYDETVQEEAEDVGLAYQSIEQTKFVAIQSWEKSIEKLSLCCKRTNCYKWITGECRLDQNQQQPDLDPSDSIKYECKIGGFIAPFLYKPPERCTFDQMSPILLQIVPYSDGVLDDLDFVTFTEDGQCVYDFH